MKNKKAYIATIETKEQLNIINIFLKFIQIKD